MTRLTRNDVIKAVGQADDVTIAEIIGTGATAEELTGSGLDRQQRTATERRQTAAERASSRVDRLVLADRVTE